MSLLLRVKTFWADIHNQRWDNLAKYFNAKAVIEWPNTNERFCVQDFIKANSEYPGKRDIAIERIERCNTTVITVARVRDSGEDTSLYATSFFEFEDSLIVRLTEYWSENGPAPEWRTKLELGV